MKTEKDRAVFSTGTDIYCFMGIIGITPDCQEVTYGNDGSLREMTEPLTKEERIELAEEMIFRWSKFREMQ